METPSAVENDNYRYKENYFPSENTTGIALCQFVLK
jgi:hypothetical protein